MSSGEWILQGHNLQKTFVGPDERIEILSGANIEVAPGESVSIRGESGAGKTTLLYLLAGLEKADAGELHWGGESVLKQSAAWMAKKRTRFMGFVFQAYYLIPELNAEQNVLMGARLAGRIGKAEKERAAELLDKVGLTNRRHHLPTQLSGGERQRVAIARALINSPALILADEPTGNLDEHTSEDVIDLLLSLCSSEETSLLLVTHNANHANRLSRQLFMRAGKLEVLG